MQIYFVQLYFWQNGHKVVVNIQHQCYEGTSNIIQLFVLMGVFLAIIIYFINSFLGRFCMNFNQGKGDKF